VSVPSLLRGPDSIWGSEPAGVRDSLGGPGAQPFWLRATSSGLRGVTGPSPSGERVRGRPAGRAGLRTTGVRLLGRQGIVKDNYEAFA